MTIKKDVKDSYFSIINYYLQAIRFIYIDALLLKFKEENRNSNKKYKNHLNTSFLKMTNVSRNY